MLLGLAPTASLWDIDNCVAEDRWRQDQIEWDREGDDRYRKYNSQLILDAVRHKREFDMFLKLGVQPVFSTGRAEYLRGETELWLQKRLDLAPGSYLMYMRPNGTTGLTPRTLKEQNLRLFLSQYPNVRVVAAFDDIPAVVQMYRDHGIPAAVLAIHSELLGAYTPADLK